MSVTLGGGTPYVEAGFTGVNPCTLTSPTISGSNNMLVISFSLNSSALLTITATLDGASIAAYRVAHDLINYTQLDVYVIPNAPSAKTISFSWGTMFCTIQACYFNGADQATGYRTPVAVAGATSGTTGSVDVTPGQAGDMLVGCFGVNDTAAADGFDSGETFNGTYLGQITNGSSEASGSMNYEALSGSGTKTVSWTKATSAGWRVAGIALQTADVADPYGTPQDHSGCKPWSSIWRPARA